jgi:hypothetical protein
VACDILVVMYFFVISIQRPPFIFACWFIVMIMRMRISHYYLKYTLSFCDCCLHIVFWVFWSLTFFIFMSVRTFDFSQLACMGFLIWLLHNSSL